MLAKDGLTLTDIKRLLSWRVSLGIHFTSITSQSALKGWSVVKDGLRAQAREVCYRELSLNKRIHFVHTYTLARAWFAAQVFPRPPTLNDKSTQQ